MMTKTTGDALKRMILLLAVAAVIAAMVVATAAPADARVGGRTCVSIVAKGIHTGDREPSDVRTICGAGN
jgi:hypothetical protein